jgi:hypothetical protein
MTPKMRGLSRAARSIPVEANRSSKPPLEPLMFRSAGAIDLGRRKVCVRLVEYSAVTATPLARLAMLTQRFISNGFLLIAGAAIAGLAVWAFILI